MVQRLYYSIAILLLLITRSVSDHDFGNRENGDEVKRVVPLENDGCSAQALTFDDRLKLIDLSSLKDRTLSVNGGDPERKGEIYSLSICKQRNFTRYGDGSCLNQMFVYENSELQSCANLGNVSRLILHEGKVTLHVYNPFDVHGEVYIQLNCTDGEPELRCDDPFNCFSLHPGTDAFVLNSRHACFDGVPKLSAVAPTPEADWLKMSPGSIILIAMSCVFTVYIMVGMSYGIGRGEKGLNRLPNSDFWLELPLLVKDGLRLTFLCKLPRGYILIKEDKAPPPPPPVDV